jgi:hypothetical protein
MTIRTGLSKKVGLADYGSLGVTCEVAFEADHALLDRDLKGFQQRVKKAYAACAQAIQDELARQQQTGTTSPTNTQPPPSNGQGSSHPSQDRQRHCIIPAGELPGDPPR